jgi:hypothetical protein
VATVTGRTVNSILPMCDTPGVATANPGNPDGLSRTAAEAAWHTVTSSIAGTPHARISRDGGRTYPARHACPLPPRPPGQPCTVPVYDPGSATGRMLAIDLDPSRGSGDPAAGVGAPGGGARGVARVSRRPVHRCSTPGTWASRCTSSRSPIRMSRQGDQGPSGPGASRRAIGIHRPGRPEC